MPCGERLVRNSSTDFCLQVSTSALSSLASGAAGRIMRVLTVDPPRRPGRAH